MEKLFMYFYVIIYSYESLSMFFGKSIRNKTIVNILFGASIFTFIIGLAPAIQYSGVYLFAELTVLVDIILSLAMIFYQNKYNLRDKVIEFANDEISIVDFISSIPNINTFIGLILIAVVNLIATTVSLFLLLPMLF